jgi:PAS domain S-box-containing protein
MKKHDPSYRPPSTTPLLDALPEIERCLRRKGADAEKIWQTFFNQLETQGIQGEIAIQQGQIRYLRYDSHVQWSSSPKIGSADTYQQIFETEESTYLPGGTNSPTNQIYCPFSPPQTPAVLTLRASDLVPEDIPIVEAVCRYLSLIWREAPLASFFPPSGKGLPAVLERDLYCKLFEKSNDAILMHDFTGNMIRANPKAEEMLGYTNQALKAMSWFSLIPKEHHQKHQDKLTALKKKGGSDLQWSSLLHSQGYEIPAEINHIVIQKEGEEPQYVLSVIKDIRERVRIENALRESEERHLYTVEYSPTGIINTVEGMITYANNTSARILGFSEAQQLIGNPLFDFFPRENREGFSSWIERFQNTAGQENVSHVKITRRDGADIYLDIYVSQVEFQSQKAIQIVFTDITDRVRAEADLRQTTQALERQTVQLQVAAEVARDAAKERKLQTLLEKAVDLVKDRFGFYHAGIFLIGEDDKYAVLTAATGEPGRKMIAEGHKLRVGQVGIVGYVAGTGEARIALDVGEDAVHFQNPHLPQTRSEIAVPLKVGETVIGVLDVQSQHQDAFGQEELRVLETMADQLAVAIQNVQLLEESQHRARQLRGLYETALATSSVLDVEAILERLYQQVDRLMAPDAFLVGLYDQENGEIQIKIAVEDGIRHTDLIDHQISMGEDSLLGWIITHNEYLLIQNLAEEDLPVPPQKIGKEILSWLGVPLVVRERLIGVVTVQSFTPYTFDEDDRNFLEALSTQVAITLENARLFEAEARERRHLSLLYQVGQQLVSSLEIEILLEQTIELITVALGGNLGIASLYDRETNTLRTAGVFGDQKESVGIQSEFAEGPTAWVMEHQQALYIPDLEQADRSFNPAPLLGKGASLTAPIISGNQLLGIITIYSEHQSDFSREHLELLEAICQQVGLALSNARRYQDVNRLADRLVREQHRQEAIIEGLPIGVLLLSEDYRLEVINEGGVEYLSQLSSAQVGDVLTHLGDYSLSEIISRSDYPLPLDITLEGPPKKIFEIQIRPVSNEVHHWIMTLQDVTMEREVQERTQMKDRLATVGQLAAGIGHDFNNIMAAILVYTELLLQHEPLPPGFESNLNVIKQQIERASDLIRQILDFSRRSVMEESQLDLLPFLKELEKLLTRTLPATIQVTFQSQPGPFMVNVDPTRLQQVFMNLAVNARDAMPEGGKLTFNLERFHHDEADSTSFSYLTPGDWAKVTVQDTGKGIPQEVLPHIFEPFFTTKDVGKGTGLGLAQVYGIIKQFGGFVDVKSSHEEGTTFFVFLPLLKGPEEKSVEREEGELIDGTGQAVLLVEDDPPARAALKSMLEMFDFSVKVASNGVEALNHLEQNRDVFEFVVSDIVMPKMGGVELYHEIQSRWPSVKMVFVTGHPLRGQEKKLLKQQKVFWLQKPFTMHEFSKLMDTFLQDDS